jgi:phosphosulfolactate phosphohydrolase-like enzyme
MDGEGIGRLSPTTIPGRTITLSAIQADSAAGTRAALAVATAAALAGGIWEAVATAAAIDERGASAKRTVD